MIASGLLLAVANIAIYAGIRSFLLGDLDAQLRTLATTELASAVDSGQGAHLHEFTVDPANPDFSEKFVQLIDAQGQLIMQSPRLGVTRPLVEGATLVAAFAGRAPLFPVDIGRPGRMIALRTAGADPYIVAVGIFTDRLEATLAWIWRLLVAVWFGTLLLTGAVGFALASRALAPIRRITSQAEAIAHGGLATRLDVPAMDDEIGRMTRLLNEMLDRLFGAIEANRRFAADASHELRSPLTGMLGEVDLALRRDRPAEEYRDVLVMAQARLHEMADLTDNLMLLVRAQERKTGVITEVAVAPLLERVAAACADASAEKRIAVDVDAKLDLIAYADERLLERVVDNLLRNALQYSGPGGHVTIVARLQERAGDWVTDELILTVRDTGPGIPREERERVFERFYRIDPSRSRRTGGAGLGLAISREIVQLFGGTIRVVDTVGPGATLEVRLPGGRVSHE